MKNGHTHYIERSDAIWHNGRQYVPTKQDTQWVNSWQQFKAVGGIMCFNEDQTEIALTLPENHKFSIQFNPNPIY